QVLACRADRPSCRSLPFVPLLRRGLGFKVFGPLAKLLFDLRFDRKPKQFPTSLRTRSKIVSVHGINRLPPRPICKPALFASFAELPSYSPPHIMPATRHSTRWRDFKRRATARSLPPCPSAGAAGHGHETDASAPYQPVFRGRPPLRRKPCLRARRE